MTNSSSIRLVFLLEELSARYFLEELLPKILPPDVSFLCIAHRGKNHLQESIPQKLKEWRVPNDFFVILHDQDQWDCKRLKRKLRALCKKANSPHKPLIRIVCRELEAWYFGDLNAVGKVFSKSKITRHGNKARYRNPDSIVNPSAELEKLLDDFGKVHAAREIPKYMNLQGNSSTSFQALLTGVHKFATACRRAHTP